MPKKAFLSLALSCHFRFDNVKQAVAKLLQGRHQQCFQYSYQVHGVKILEPRLTLGDLGECVL